MLSRKSRFVASAEDGGVGDLLIRFLESLIAAPAAVVVIRLPYSALAPAALARISILRCRVGS